MSIVASIVQAFLTRIAGSLLRANGTVQIGNRVAKYYVRDLNGGIDDCQFRIDFNILGNLFMLAGSIRAGRVSWDAVLMAGKGGRMVPAESGVVKASFGVDPAQWIKRTISDAISRSVSGRPDDIRNFIVVDGSIVDISPIPDEDAQEALKAS